MYDINFFYVNRIRNIIRLILLIVIFTVSLLLFRELYIYNNLKIEAESLESNLNKSKIDEIDALKAEIKKIGDKKEYLKNIKTVNIKDIYNKLNSLRGTDVTISFLRLENLDMDLEVISDNKTSLLKYKENLEKLNIGNIRFVMLREEEEEYKYKLGVKIYE